MGRSDERRIDAVTYTVLAAVVLGSWVFRFANQGTGTPLDTVTYFLPIYEATASRLAQGVVPLWNPYQLAGIPWVATLQGGVFYPGHVLYVVLPLQAALALSNVLHLLLVAVATAVFIRRVGVGPAAAFIAAVVVSLRGYVPTYQVAPNHLEAYAWLPVGAIACLQLVRHPGARPIALLAAATAMSLLAGYPQPTVYLVYAWATLTLALAIDARVDRRGLVAAGLGFGAAVALGAMVAGVQMLPAAELTRLGVRTPDDLAERAMFPMSATFTPALLPLRFGAIVGKPLSFGVAVLALFAVALVARRRRAVAWWAVGFSVVTVLFALGDLTPAFSVYRVLPGLMWFRNPHRILAVTEFSVAIAAACGLDAIVGAGTGARSRAAALCGAIAAGGIVWLAAAGWAPAELWWQVVVRAVVLLAGVAAALVRTDAARTVAIVALLGLVVGETSATPWLGLRLPYAASDVAQLRVSEAPLREVAERAGHDRIWRYGASSMLQPEHMLKLATLFGYRAINDYEPLSLGRQASFFTYFTEGSTRQERPPWLFAGTIGTLESPPGIPPPSRRHRLLDLLATRFLVLSPGMRVGDPALNAFLGEAEWTEVQVGTPYKVFENPTVLPRAFVTYRTRPAPASPDPLLLAISRPAFDPLVESYVEGDAPTASPDAPRGHPARFVHDGESEVELEATLERPGLVVLADSFYPGWHATVDGRPAPILATNLLFRGVRVDAGTHRVRFVYAPASIRYGAACSALGLVVLVWLARRRDRVTGCSPSRADAPPSRA